MGVRWSWFWPGRFLGKRRGADCSPTFSSGMLLLDEDKVPLVIVACGSFSPPTYLHL